MEYFMNKPFHMNETNYSMVSYDFQKRCTLNPSKDARFENAVEP